MGYYIQTEGNFNKAEEIVRLYRGTKLSHAPDFDQVPADLAVICVVDNGFFEAAGFCYDKAELEVFAEPDRRPRAWLLMNRAKAEELTGFRR